MINRPPAKRVQGRKVREAINKILLELRKRINPIISVISGKKAQPNPFANFASLAVNNL